MKTAFLFMIMLVLFSGCMKSKNEYRDAIQDVQKEEYNDAVEAQKRHQNIQRQEEEAPERSRGSNDAEGMGMDE